MLSLIAKVKLAGAVYERVASVKIVTSLDEFMDTATLIVPQADRKKYKKGDEVEIQLGYDRYGLNGEFFGTITEISQQPPFEIKCADQFYQLRQGNVHNTYSNQTIDFILRDSLKGSGVTAIISEKAKAQKLASFITWGKNNNNETFNLTRRAVVQKLANDYGYCAYFYGKRLHFLHRTEMVMPGATYPLYEEGKSIISNTLLYGEPDAIKQIKVVSEHRVGSYVYGVYPYSYQIRNRTGEQRAYYVDGLGDGPACTSRAEELYKQLTATGFYGELRTFGHPYVRAGMFCGIKLNSVPQPTIQAIRKTEVTFDRGGFRRLIIPMSVPRDVIDKNELMRRVAAVNYLLRVGAR